MARSRVTAVATILAAIVVGAMPTVALADANTTARASHGDPYADCVLPPRPSNTNWKGAETEPYIAVDPKDKSSVVAVFMQDDHAGDVAAWSSDGGKTFRESTLPFSHCAPGGLPYERGVDPWVSIGPDGIVYATGIGATARFSPTPTTAIVAATSRDGGKTWSGGRTLDVNANSAQFLNDKPSVTADPRLKHRAYVAWSQSNTPDPNNPNQFTVPTLLSITDDGGRSWSIPRVIVPAPTGVANSGNVILADSNTGRLFDLYQHSVFDAVGDLTSAEYDAVR